MSINRNADDGKNLERTALLSHCTNLQVSPRQTTPFSIRSKHSSSVIIQCTAICTIFFQEGKEKLPHYLTQSLSYLYQ